MQIILSVILWTVFGLLTLLLVALFMPICIAVEVDYDKPKAWLKILFFKYQIYPIKEKPKKQKEKSAVKTSENDESEQIKAEQAEIKQTQEENSKPNIKMPKLDFEKVISLLNAAGAAIKIIFKGLFFTKIRIIYPVHDEDSAQTAVKYGQTQAYFGGIAASLQNFIHLSFKSVNIIPDFTNEHKYRRYFSCNIWSCTFIILIAGIYALIKLKKENVI